VPIASSRSPSTKVVLGPNPFRLLAPRRRERLPRCIVVLLVRIGVVSLLNSAYRKQVGRTKPVAELPLPEVRSVVNEVEASLRLKPSHDYFDASPVTRRFG
jgi:hypothetical protein